MKNSAKPAKGFVFFAKNFAFSAVKDILLCVLAERSGKIKILFIRQIRFIGVSILRINILKSGRTARSKKSVFTRTIRLIGVSILRINILKSDRGGQTKNIRVHPYNPSHQCIHPRINILGLGRTTSPKKNPCSPLKSISSERPSSASTNHLLKIIFA
ncbi:MAG: hypothetical protein ABIT07_08170 [Ferruginibacter sp.]